jgi:phage shock protein PspC (stress-responsive transcriptional regulator)
MKYFDRVEVIFAVGGIIGVILYIVSNLWMPS